MGFRVADLKALTATLASDLAARGVAEAELARIRPGGEDNPSRDAWAWVRYHGRICALRERVQRDAPGSDAAAVADQQILEALAGTAKPVTLSEPTHAAHRLAVHPKSAIALMMCHVRNLEVARLLAYMAQLGASDDPEASTVLTRAGLEALYQHRVLAWIACTPGPGLPFAELEADPALPAPFVDLAPQDLITICRAFDEVNWARLRAIEPLITPDPDEDDAPRRRPSWSQFFASLAASEGRPSEHVLRDRSLAGLRATTQLAASAQREAIADAKEKSRASAGEDS